MTTRQLLASRDFALARWLRWVGEYLLREEEESLEEAAKRIEELASALWDLVNHDVAADKREGLDHCIELQEAIFVLMGKDEEDES